MKSPIAELIVLNLGSKGCKLKTPKRHSVVSLTFYLCFVLVKTGKKGNHPDMTEQLLTGT